MRTTKFPFIQANQLAAAAIGLLLIATNSRAAGNSGQASDFHLTLNPELEVLTYNVDFTGAWADSSVAAPQPAPHSSFVPSSIPTSSYTPNPQPAPNPQPGPQPLIHTPTYGPDGHSVNQPGPTPGPNPKPVPAVEGAAPSLLHFMASSGYSSLYMVRGLDVGARTSIDGSNKNEHFSISNASMFIQDFGVSFSYIQSLDSYIPAGAYHSYGPYSAGGGILPNALAPQRGYQVPQSSYYQEYDVMAAYSFHPAKKLDLTIGLNGYWFANSQFWKSKSGAPVNYTMETQTSLNWTAVPHVNQTLSYYYDFVAFEGAYLEYKASSSYKVLGSKDGAFSVSIEPGVAVSYDLKYNASKNGWNSVEPGVDIPVKLADGLTLDLGAHYSHDLGSTTGGSGQRTDNRFWYTANLQFLFPNGSSKPAPIVADSKEVKHGKSIISDISLGEAQEGRWRIAAGAGVKVLHTSYNVGVPANLTTNAYYNANTSPVSVGASFPSNSSPTVGLANNTTTVSYLSNGVGIGQISAGNNSTGMAVFSNGSLRSNPYAGTFQQVDFYTRSAPVTASQSFNAVSNDAVVNPYINFSYELFSAGKFGTEIGIGYSYDNLNNNSGMQLVNLQSGTTYIYTYVMTSPVVGSTATGTALASGTLIWNGATFAHFVDPNGLFSLPNYNPQVSASTVSIAAFRSAKVDLNMHSPSIPINLSYNVTDRIQARVSFGPTFNLYDSNLSTQTDYQLVTTGAFTPGIPGQSGSNAQSSTVAPVPPPGGKGAGSGKSSALPGVNVGTANSRATGLGFEVGAFAQLSAQIDMDSAKRWFVEVYGRYDYVPSFTLSDGASSVKISPSSFGGGIGVGLRF